MDFGIDGTPGNDKVDTMITARLGHAAGPIIAALGVHVYREIEIDVVFARVFDPTSPGTMIDSAKPDYALVEKRMNEIAKQVVVKFNVTDGTPLGDLPVPYDLNKNGELELELPGGFDVPPEFAGIADRLGFESPHVIVVVRNLLWAYRLQQPARRGDTVLHVDQEHGTWSHWFAQPERRQFAMLRDGGGDDHVSTTGLGEHKVQLDHPLARGFASNARLVFRAKIATFWPVNEANAAADTTAWFATHVVMHRVFRYGWTRSEGNLMAFPHDPSRAQLRWRLVRPPWSKTREPVRQWDKERVP